MTITGVILAGGQSSRFGKPKMFETWQGEPLYMTAVQAFQRADLPYVISTNAQLAARFHVPKHALFIEEHTFEGPLYALSEVMKQHASDWFFVVAADMPFLNATFVQKLTVHISENIDAIVPYADEQVQPLAALYHRRILPIIEKTLQEKRKSMRAIFPHIRVQQVPFSNQKTFTNINYVADWPQHEKESHHE